MEPTDNNFDGFLVSFNWRTEEFDGLYNEELMNTFPEINLSNQPENKLAIKEEQPPLNPSHKFANNNTNNFDPSTTLFSPLLGLYAAKQQQEEKYSSQLSRDVNKKNKDIFNSIENRQSSSSSKSDIPKVNKRNKVVSNDKPPEQILAYNNNTTTQVNKKLKTTKSYVPVTSYSSSSMHSIPNQINTLQSNNDPPVQTSNARDKNPQVIAAKERRRERNKVLARKTRVKKKAELEILRSQVSFLENENRKLKVIVTKKLPHQVRGKLLESCESSLPDNVSAAIQSLACKSDNTLAFIAEKLSKTQRSFCISNPLTDGNPIIYASTAFVELTGYPLEDIIGKNCRFLQGPDTNKEDIKVITNGIKNGLNVTIPLLNYRADGSKFWNLIQLCPMRNSKKEVVLYVGLQTPITEKKAAQIKMANIMFSETTVMYNNNKNQSLGSGSTDRSDSGSLDDEIYAHLNPSQFMQPFNDISTSSESPDNSY